MFKMKKSVLMCAFALLLGSETKAEFGDYINSGMLATVAIGGGATAFGKGILAWYNQLGLKAALAAAQKAANPADSTTSTLDTDTVPNKATDSVAPALSELEHAKSVLAQAKAKEAKATFQKSKSQLFWRKLQLPKQTIGFALVGVALLLTAQQLDSNKTLQGLVVESCLSAAERIIGTKNATTMQSAFAGLLTAASLRIPS